MATTNISGNTFSSWIKYYSSSVSTSFGGFSQPEPEGPIDPTKLDDIRSEVLVKLTVENEKPGFRTGDNLYSPDALNERVIELVFAILLREGLLGEGKGGAKRS